MRCFMGRKENEPLLKTESFGWFNESIESPLRLNPQTQANVTRLDA